MVRAIITWSLHNRLVVLLGTIILVALGLYSAWDLNVEAYPDPTPPMVEVISQNPGASPEEMERLVGIPLETALNGMPGLEARLPLLFNAMVSQDRLGLEKFVLLAATEPAKIYGLHPRKGEIVIGADGDIAIWDPNRKVTIGAALMHDLTGYSPYEGRTVTGWPVTVLSRGRVVVEDGTLRVAPGSGRFLPREAGAAAVPTGRRGPEFDPAQNFGAHI